MDSEIQKRRFLLWHPESDSLFEVFGEDERRMSMQGDPLVVDVTGIEERESAWRKQEGIRPT